MYVYFHYTLQDDAVNKLCQNYATRNATQKNKTLDFSRVLHCGRWDLNPIIAFLQNLIKSILSRKPL